MTVSTTWGTYQLWASSVVLLIYWFSLEALGIPRLPENAHLYFSE